MRTHLNMDHHQSVDFISLEIFSRCGDVWENREKTGIKKTLWGVPFPSPKIVQNEHFYIILLTKKVGMTVFQFWVGRLCTYTP